MVQNIMVLRYNRVFYCFIFIIHIHYSLNSSIKSINLFSFQSTCNLYCPISQQKLLCSYVRQKNISILMIVIKRLWASVFHNIIIEENLKSKSVLSYFCKNLLIKLFICIHSHYTTQNLRANQNPLNPWTIWWDIFYKIGHFYSTLKLVKMQIVWNITTIFYWS